MSAPKGTAPGARVPRTGLVYSCPVNPGICSPLPGKLSDSSGKSENSNAFTMYVHVCNTVTNCMTNIIDNINVAIRFNWGSLAGQTFRGGRERLVTVVDFPCAIAECCDVQLDYSIRNNEVQSCDITSALCACASSTCTYARNTCTTYAVYACRFITAYFPRDNMCYVTANEIPRAHGKSITVTRRSLPPTSRGGWKCG